MHVGKQQVTNKLVRKIIEEYLPWAQAVGARILWQESRKNGQRQNIYQKNVNSIIDILQK